MHFQIRGIAAWGIFYCGALATSACSEPGSSTTGNTSDAAAETLSSGGTGSGGSGGSTASPGLRCGNTSCQPIAPPALLASATGPLPACCFSENECGGNSASLKLALESMVDETDTELPEMPECMSESDIAALADMGGLTESEVILDSSCNGAVSIGMGPGMGVDLAGRCTAAGVCGGDTASVNAVASSYGVNLPVPCATQDELSAALPATFATMAQVSGTGDAPCGVDSGGPQPDGSTGDAGGDANSEAGSDSGILDASDSGG